MLNNKYSMKLSDLNTIKAALPGVTLEDAFRLHNDGTIDDIIECTSEAAEEACIDDIAKIVTSRSFIRWCAKHRKVITAAMVLVPGFSLAMYGLRPGSFLMQLVNTTSAVPGALGEVLTDIQSYTALNDGALPAMAAAGNAGFFAGKGIILLHMLIVGFFTLIVSSFLKFTGRGDFIPLVAFVGGAAILYEVVNLFTDIYNSISTLLNM